MSDSAKDNPLNSPLPPPGTTVEEARKVVIRELCSGACESYSPSDDGYGYCRHCGVVERCHEEIQLIDALIAASLSEGKEAWEQMRSRALNAEAKLAALQSSPQLGEKK